MAECAGPGALGGLARAVTSTDGFSPLQERWAPVSSIVPAGVSEPMATPERVQESLRAFLRATAAGRPLEPSFPSSHLTGLAPRDAQRLLSRAEDLCRHLCASQSTPQIARANLEALARQFGAVDARPNAGISARELGWSAGVHQEAFERAWESSRTAESWASEFAPRAAVLPPLGAPLTNSMQSAWEQITSGSGTATASEGARMEEAWGQAVYGGGEAAVQSSAQKAVEAIRGTAGVGGTKFAALMSSLADGRARVQGDSISGAVQETTGESWAQEFVTGVRPEARDWAQEYREQETMPGDQGTVGAQSRLEEETKFRGYHFVPASSNPFVGHPNVLEEGKALYGEGKCAAAVLALEAGLRLSSGDSAAWRLLGVAHAECDDDTRAISALSVARSLLPDDREALLSLAVSLANDLYRDQALGVLRDWISLHPEYRSLLSLYPEAPGAESRARLAQATALFERAAALHPAPFEADADVHTALGLLHSMASQFGKAADHFRLAIARNPISHQLWNKLGATLANGDNSQEACDAYRMALRLRPGYLRAHSNLGIALMALSDPQEAAREFLHALRLDQTAEHLWENLVLALRTMHRDDLVARAVAKDLKAFDGEL